MGSAAKILMHLMLVGYAYSESCLFDFERDVELGDFNTTCNGNKQTLVIVDKPVTIQQPSEPVGNRGLTVLKENDSCMISLKQIKMQTKQVIKVFFYVKRKSWSDFGSFVIILECTSFPAIKWSILDEFIATPPENVPDGNWMILNNEFSLLPDTACNVKVELYKNGEFEIYVDKIEIVDPLSASGECYVVERPAQTTDSTAGTDTTQSTSETTSTTDESTSSTSASTDTTQSTIGTTSTTDEASASTDTTQSTIGTTSTTDEASASTDTTQSTIGTTSTTNEGSASTDTTQSTTETTATTDESISATSASTTEPTEIASTSTTTEDTNENSTTNSSQMSTLSPPMTETGYPEFSFFFIVIIIAASGTMSLISLLLCFILLRRRNKIKKRRNKKVQQPYRVFYS